MLIVGAFLDRLLRESLSLKLEGCIIIHMNYAP